MSGSLSQAQGLVDAMGLQAKTYLTQVQKPWSTLPLILQPKSTKIFHCPQPPWPDLLVASAKGTILPALAVKKANPNTHILYLQKPRYFGKYFDTIVTPIHDGYSGDNTIETLGAPHRASKERIAESLQKSFEPIQAT